MDMLSRVLAAGYVGLVMAAASCGITTAKAATEIENFTLSGIAVQNNSGDDGINTTSFAQFNTSLGTLTSVGLSFSGTANYSGSYDANFDFVSPASDVNEELNFSTSGNGFGTGNFSISASGSDHSASDLSNYFEGSGTLALVFEFGVDGGTVSASEQPGELIYSFTPGVSSPPTTVPEPGSLSMFGAGLAGLLLLVRRRLPLAARTPHVRKP